VLQGILTINNVRYVLLGLQGDIDITDAANIMLYFLNQVQNRRIK